MPDLIDNVFPNVNQVDIDLNTVTEAELDPVDQAFPVLGEEQPPVQQEPDIVDEVFPNPEESVALQPVVSEYGEVVPRSPGQQREAILQETGQIQEITPEYETPVGDIWENAFNDIKAIGQGIGAIIGGTASFAVETGKEAVVEAMDIVPLPEEIQDKLKSVFEDDPEEAGLVQFIAELSEGDTARVERIAEIGKQVASSVFTEFKELVGQGDISPWESVKRHPFNQVMNALTILSLGAGSVVKVGQATAKVGAIGSRAGEIGRVSKIGKALENVGQAARPASIAKKTIEVTPIVNEWASKLTIARNAAFHLNQLRKQEKIIAEAKFGKIESALRKLDPDEIKVFSQVMEGETLVKPTQRVLDALDEFDGLFDFELKLLNVGPKYDTVVENFIRTFNKKANDVVARNGITKVQKVQVDELLEGLNGDIPTRDFKPGGNHLRGVEFDMAGQLQKKLGGTTSAFREGGENAHLTEYAKMKWREMEYTNVREDIQRVSFKEDRVFRPMAIAMGVMTPKQFELGRRLTGKQVNSLRKEYQKLFPDREAPVYFPRIAAKVNSDDIAIFKDKKTGSWIARNKLTLEDIGEFTSRKAAVEAKKEVIGSAASQIADKSKYISDIYRPGKKSYQYLMTGKNKDFIKNVEIAAKKRVLQSSNRQAQIEVVKNYILDLEKKGQAKLLTDGKILDGHVVVDIQSFDRFHRVSDVVENKMLDELRKSSGSFDLIWDRLEMSGKQIEDAMGTGSTTAFQIPIEQAKALRKQMDHLTSGTPAPIKILWDNPTVFWRNSVLALSPRWVVNGAIGNFILNTVAGVGPLAYARTLPSFMYEAAKSWGLDKLPFVNVLKSSKNKIDRLVPNEVTSGTFFSTQKQLSNFSDQLVKETNGVVKKSINALAWPFRKTVDNMFELNTAMENFFRRANYVDFATKQARKKAFKATADKFFRSYDDASVTKSGGGLREVAKMSNDEIALGVKRVNEFLFNYENLTPFERAYLRRIIPFYSWFRNINQFFWTLPVKYPGRAWGLKTISDMGEEALMNDDVPEWMRGAIRAGTDDRGNALFVSTNGANPFFGVEAPSIGLNPILKIPLERSLGVDFFRKRPFQSPGAPFLGKSKEIDPATGEVRQDVVTPDFIMHIARQFPQFNLIEEAFAGAQVYDTSTLANPQVKEFDDKIDVLEKRLDRLTSRRPPRKPSQRRKWRGDVAKVREELQEMRIDKQQSEVKLWTLFGKYGKQAQVKGVDVPFVDERQIYARYPRDFKFSLLKMFGINVVPIDQEEFSERKEKARKQAIDEQFREVMSLRPDIAEYAESVFRISEERKAEEARKKKIRRRLRKSYR